MRLKNGSKLFPWASNIIFYRWKKNNKRYSPNKSSWIAHRRRHWLTVYASKRGCECCGYSDARALDYDHIDPTNKISGVKSTSFLQLVGFKNRRNVINEVRKCRILCSNCHRIKTLDEGDKDQCANPELRQQHYDEYIRNKSTSQTTVSQQNVLAGQEKQD